MKPEQQYPNDKILQSLQNSLRETIAALKLKYKTEEQQQKGDIAKQW